MNISGINKDQERKIQDLRPTKNAHVRSFGGRIAGFAVFFVICVLSNCCTKPAAHAEEVIRIGGVGGALATMRILASAFEKSNPGIKVAVLPSIGTSGALKAVPDGAIDIGLLGLPSKGEVLVSGATVTEYARTPFIFVTRRETQKNGLTFEEVAKIYRGDIRSWPGGERIRTIMRRRDDTDNLVLKGLSPAIRAALDKSLSQRGLLFAVTDQDNLDIIERTPGALGYTTLAQVISENRRVKVLALGGIVPSVKALADGRYPVYKILYMMTKREPPGGVLKFVSFVMSEDGAKILKEYGNMATRNK